MSCTRKASNWYFKRCGLKNYREKVRENVCITSCTRKASNWYFKHCGLKKYEKKSTWNVLECHVLEKQVTNISCVVIWKSTGKCLITSSTRKASNWYFKRCGLKNYSEKVRENVCITSCTRKASNWYFKRLWFEKVQKNVFITSCTITATNGYFKRCVLKKYGENVRGNVFITSCTLKASNWYFVRCHLKKYGKMFYYVMYQKTKKLIFKCWGLKKYRKIFF